MPWGLSSCQSSTPGIRETILAEVTGDFTRHDASTTVFVQANVAYVRAAGPHRGFDFDLVVQVYGPKGWEDFKTKRAIAYAYSQFFELEVDNVPAGTPVRAQLRGTIECNASYNAGYSIRGMRILVETCIPDHVNEGKCL